MSNKRMISSDTFEDEWVGSLNYLERLIWIGLIAACADDQGRMLSNPALIKSKIFPFEDLPLEQIKAALYKFGEAGKLLMYSSDGKALIQIIHWWDYQKPAWAAPSKYNPPENWIDRVRINAKGNKPIIESWNQPGGFQSDEVCTQVHTMVSTQVIKDNVKDKDKDNVLGGGIFELYEQAIGTVPTTIVEELKDIEKRYDYAWLVDAFKIAVVRNKRSWGYVKGILRRFETQGYTPYDSSVSTTYVDPRNIPTETW